MCISMVDLADPRIRRIIMLMRAGDWHERDDKPTCPRCGRGLRDGLCGACRRVARCHDDPEYRGRILRGKQRYRERTRSRT